MQSPQDSKTLVPRTSIRHRYGLTRLGYHFLFVALFAMIGGSIRGFNLLLVLSGLLISVILVQWRCGRAMIRLAGVARRLPQDVFAGRPFEIHYLVTNRGRWLPVWMLQIKDQIKNLSVKNPTIRGERSQSVIHVAAGFVAPKSSVDTSCHCLITARGRYQLGPVRLSTGFPFSLMESAKRIDRHDLAAQVVVYPGLVEIHRRWFEDLALAARGSGGPAARVNGLDGEFFGLREWNSGDNPRWIHWRTSARLTEPAVRQFEQTNRREITLVLDCSENPSSGNPSSGNQPPGNKSIERETVPSGATDASHVQVETAISLATELSNRFLSRDARSLELRHFVIAICQQHPVIIETARCRNARKEILTALADAVVETPENGKLLLQRTMGSLSQNQTGRRSHLIVVSTRSLSQSLGQPDETDVEAPNSARTLRQLLALWQRRQQLTWINVSDENECRRIFRAGETFQSVESKVHGGPE